MIARMWRGWAASVAAADAYEEFLRGEFLPAAATIAGYRGAEVLRRPSGDEVEFVTVTRFDTLEAIQAFAGDDLERAHVAPRARTLLARFEERCAHFQLAIDTTKDAAP